MTDAIGKENGGPQCQYFVIRKKRLCRMTVRPGKQYCGEHEPQPKTNDDKDDRRIPCPNDPKHTCFASKLEKHLTVCNARKQEEPEYIIHNINLGSQSEEYLRRPLTEVPPKTLMDIIDKINLLYDEYLEHKIFKLPAKPIHTSVLEEFSEEGRGENSLRHLRQVSSLLHLVEDEGLVQPNTCYVDLGAGKGQLGAHAWRAWGARGAVVLVERAALRHKRDRRAQLTRLRHDLAHLALARLPAAARADSLVGLAKHLCGAATDFALRCLCAADAVEKVSGLVMATCCHHRCERAHYVAADALRKHGISAEDFDVMLGVVSWATCGDGLGRERRARGDAPRRPAPERAEELNSDELTTDERRAAPSADELAATVRRAALSAAERATVGRRAKALVDWGRVQFLRERGFDARLVQFVSSDVSPENVCIVASRAMAAS